MTPLKTIELLNAMLIKKGSPDEVTFNYTTNGYVEMITLSLFGEEIHIWDSENSYIDDNETLMGHCISQFKEFRKNLKKIKL